ncbi:MAG TPA: ribonuclease H [Mycobacteriales bacterium]|nr:ribonuclease H [Mycobacteriales bacterium]
MATVVFTDGACLGNPGPGGWAWAVSDEHFASGSAEATTNQRMELCAVIEAVASLSGPLEIVSDSTYVVKCFQDRWWASWRRRSWRNSKGEPVANQDLWVDLIAAVVDERPGEIHFRWVKGHSGDPMNEFVDRLANDAARAQSDRAILPGASFARQGES